MFSWHLRVMEMKSVTTEAGAVGQIFGPRVKDNQILHNTVVNIVISFLI